ncbi:MAG TPA: glycosyltransferase family 4 protein [Methanoregulaceae archaeon]|nr:glycosyltransferase family 4 protein [Methanoregulaceae archaeon]HPD10856.1 glycosyltransferase family 4 protein [Methanoregulaceae archaeon]HRT15652.1 glycosyltransferase family 4 protein [Methanoregulaceae archaeon]HRU31509.1 glycosyltransferase family 4 protein [Methanoregulaceae archaeon]
MNENVPDHHGTTPPGKEVCIVIMGPSTRFLSGITYFTIRLANALAGIGQIDALLFRHMLPLKLFPGWKRVGRIRTDEKFLPAVGVAEILDWYNPLTWMRAYAIARKAEVLIIPWWTSSVAHMYLFLQVLTRKRVFTVIDFHEPVDPLEDATLPLRMYARITGRMVRELADGYVAHTLYDRDLIVKRYGILPEEVAIIPHGLYDQYASIKTDEARRRLGIREEYVILFFGLLRKFKGVRYLIEGFEQLPDDVRTNSRLCIVGEAWEDQESVAMARSSPDSGRITVVDRYISDEEVALFYSASDVFVGPYTKEAHDPCAVCHIAMSYGIPVVASHTGGMIESLGSYPGVFFVPPEDPAAIANALVQVFQDLGKRYEAPEELRWDQVARKWKSLLSSAGIG